jgi:hypothetical protein
MVEEWANIPGWPNYQASNLGRIKRLAGVSFDGKRRLKEHNIKQTLIRHKRIGREYIEVRVNIGNSKYHEFVSVARLVLLAFVGPPEPGQECRHLNDVSTDCKLSNLAWGTRLENREDAIKNDRMARGTRNGMSILTEEDIPLIRSRYKPYNQVDGAIAIASDYGVSPGTIYDILSGMTWRSA